MTFPLTLLESVYTAKDGKLTAYQLSKLATSGKHCLVRLNKASENGVSFTVCGLVTTKYISKVSKAGLEKGVQPVIIEPGFPVIFDINLQYKDKDGKDSEGKKQAECFVKILDGKGVKTGEVRWMCLDIGAIPESGMRANALKAALADNEDDGENYCFVGPALSAGVDIVEIQEKWGYSPQGWAEAYALIAGNTFVEGKAYAPKKTFKETLMERVADIESLTTEEAARIIKLVQDSYPDSESAWSAICHAWLTSI